MSGNFVETWRKSGKSQEILSVKWILWRPTVELYQCQFHLSSLKCKHAIWNIIEWSVNASTCCCDNRECTLILISDIFSTLGCCLRIVNYIGCSFVATSWTICYMSIHDSISFISLKLNFRNMPKQTFFSDKRLEEAEFKDWIKKVDNNIHFGCKRCKKNDLSLWNMCSEALQKHAKSKKHCKAREEWIEVQNFFTEQNHASCSPQAPEQVIDVELACSTRQVSTKSRQLLLKAWKVTMCGKQTLFGLWLLEIFFQITLQQMSVKPLKAYLLTVKLWAVFSAVRTKSNIWLIGGYRSLYKGSVSTRNE